jgi:hypothetical protein
MKKLFAFLLLTSLFACKQGQPDEQPKSVPNTTKTVKIHMIFKDHDYFDSFFVMKADDGHDYYTFDWGKDLLHSPDCQLCLSRATTGTTTQTIVKHDTVYVEQPYKKGLKLLCVNAGEVIQGNRIHDETNNLVEGKIYTTMVPAYIDHATNDSVYYIDGVGERVINRFVKLPK